MWAQSPALWAVGVRDFTETILFIIVFTIRLVWGEIINVLVYMHADEDTFECRIFEGKRFIVLLPPEHEQLQSVCEAFYGEAFVLGRSRPSCVEWQSCAQRHFN